MRSLHEDSLQPGALVAHLHNCRYHVLHKAVECCGYTIQAEGDNGDCWDLCWSDLSVTQERVSRLKSFQRLNHFPGMLEICRKASLSRHLARMCARLPHEYDYYPQSMVLPDQLAELVVELKKNKAMLDSGITNVPTFILKPSGGTMGRGIALVQTLQHLQALPDICNTVAQLYVPNPLLLDGFKFDMRIYACVASIDPLRIFLYDEGLARLATDTYQVPTIDNLHTATMHLTNYAINRGTHPGLQQESSTKRPASQVLEAVARAGNVSKASLVDEISAIVVKTVLAVQPLLSHTYHTSLPAAVDTYGAEQQCTHLGHLHPDIVCPISKTGSEQRSAAQAAAITTNPCGCAPSKCFELLGFDIMFDDKLHPWLLEVNHSPSFACDTSLDHQVKSALLSDTVKALEQTSADKAQYLQSESRALAERLYAPSSGTARKRPLSALPRSRQLQAAAVALDDMAAGLKMNGGSGSTHWHGTASPLNAESSWRSDGRGAKGDQRQGQGGGIEGVAGSCGLLQDIDPQPSCQIRAYRYTQIYPPQTSDAAERFAHVLCVATDAFPDQRCQCAYCARRRESRLLRATSSELWSAIRSSSATMKGLPCGIGGNVRTPAGGHMFASVGAGSGPHRSQSAQRALRAASRPPSGRSSTPRTRSTHHQQQQQQQQQQQLGGGFAAWAGGHRPASASRNNNNNNSPSAVPAQATAGSAAAGASCCSTHSVSGNSNRVHGAAGTACACGDAGSHSTRSARSTSSSGVTVTLEGSTGSLSSLPSSSSSGSSSCSSRAGQQHTCARATQCPQCGAATHTGVTGSGAAFAPHDSMHSVRSRPSSARSSTPRPVHSCAHPFPDHPTQGIRAPSAPWSSCTTHTHAQDSPASCDACTANRQPATPPRPSSARARASQGRHPGSSSLTAASTTPSEPCPHLWSPNRPLSSATPTPHPLTLNSNTTPTSAHQHPSPTHTHTHHLTQHHRPPPCTRPRSSPAPHRHASTLTHSASNAHFVGAHSEIKTHVAGHGAGSGGGTTSSSSSASAAAAAAAAGSAGSAAVGLKQQEMGPGGGGGGRPSSAGSLGATVHHTPRDCAPCTTSTHHTPPRVPRVAGLPTRRQRVPAPVIDITLVAMRVNLLSNRFVSPLLLQHQWQQQQKQGGKQRRASSGSRGMESKLRPASAQEPSSESTPSELQADNAHRRSSKSSGAEDTPNPWLARARAAFQEREAAEAAAASSALATQSEA